MIILFLIYNWTIIFLQTEHGIFKKTHLINCVLDKRTIIFMIFYIEHTTATITAKLYPFFWYFLHILELQNLGRVVKVYCKGSKTKLKKKC